MAQLIIEIGCEEIPAGYIKPALAAMSERIEKQLAEWELEFGKTHTFGTPRRLGLVVDGVTEQQQDKTVTVVGPKVDICYKDGEPTKVALGFAKGQGVNVDQLEKVEGPKGLCVSATKQIKGIPASELLAQFLPGMIAKLPFPKSMRWSNISETFVRPVHWIVALLDGKTIPFSFAGIDSGNKSRGHRFMKPDEIEVKNAECFFEDLKAAYVLPFQAARQTMVADQAGKLAKECGGELLENDKLVNEVANLVEYPFGAVGEFEEEYLEVPKEILISSMTSHQRYFPIVDANGELLPRFILFLNTNVEDTAIAVKGNERVLRARLADARFFYLEDRKQSLEAFTGGLSNVTFEERLGSIAEKVTRIEEHVRYLVSSINAEVLDAALRTAKLCKADLLTNVVCEFPDLQGKMGRIYAEKDKEPKEVCQAIEQHYRPRFSDDALPQTDTAAIVALGDKLDTIVGCFGVGLKPSGTADPYALRRQALGILRTLVSGNYRVSLASWVEFAAQTLKDKLKRPTDEVVKDVMTFFAGRYKNWRNNSFSQDAIEAVVGIDFDILPDVEGKIAALTEFQKDENFESLAIAFKRVMNILKQRSDTVINPDLFESDSERNLWNGYQKVRDDVVPMLKSGDFLDALNKMAELRLTVDTFFDDVMVMVDDSTVRDNRLSLLTHLADLFSRIADFRKIQTENQG